jgi:8-oxo-dGTP pyrophosphatase MutT (NUDIX family)
MEELAQAATVVLLRDTDGGLETLLLRRNRKLAFGPDAWVFPGGRVDNGDRRRGDEQLDAARRAAVREVAEEAGLVLAEADLVPLAHWTPPAIVPRRYATWFFVARAPEGAITIDGGEIVDHVWVSPAEALERHASAAVELMEPTWVTLLRLSQHDDVAAALDAARRGPLEIHVTKMVMDDAGNRISLWQEDAGYERGSPDAAGPRHRLNAGLRPWRYERSD